MTQPAPPPAKQSAPDIDRVIVREYPKVVFLYPSAIAAALCAILALIYPPGPGGAEGEPGAAAVVGAIFMTVFIFNLFVISFDFGSLVTFSLVVGIFALALLAYVVNQTWVFLPALSRFVRAVDLEMSFHFYLLYALTLGLIYLAVFIIRRFYYWEIKHNEILYHQGLWGDVERHPTIGLKMTKELNDLFEFLLWRSGRLTLQVRDREAPYVLENVPNINRVEALIQQITGRMAVEVEGGR